MNAVTLNPIAARSRLPARKKRLIPLKVPHKAWWQSKSLYSCMLTQDDSIPVICAPVDKLRKKDAFYDRLFNILEIPSATANELAMVAYVEGRLVQTGCTVQRDDIGNVYATKGVLEEGEFYPCFAAHLDTVHSTQVDPLLFIKDGFVGAVNIETGEQCGVGGDDKCGIFACLEMATVLPKVKLALFVAEEKSCLGAWNADMSFFADVGWITEVDAPEFQECSQELTYGFTTLFPNNSDFENRISPVIRRIVGSGMKFVSHSFTDIGAILARTDFCGVNICAGYYDMHTEYEVVNIEEIRKVVEMCQRLAEVLGLRKYVHVRKACSETERDISNKLIRYNNLKNGRGEYEGVDWNYSANNSNYSSGWGRKTYSELTFDSIIEFALEEKIVTTEQLKNMDEGQLAELASDVMKKSILNLGPAGINKLITDRTNVNNYEYSGSCD